MKKLITLFTLFTLFMPAYSITWVDIVAPNGKSASLDIDSIREYKHYYFYNVRVHNHNTGKNIIVTMQSRKNGGMSARINHQDEETYESLEGNYNNITENMTTNLQAVEYASVANACYNKVKSIQVQKEIQVDF